MKKLIHRVLGLRSLVQTCLKKVFWKSLLRKKMAVWRRPGLLWQSSPGVPSGEQTLSVLTRTGRRAVSARAQTFLPPELKLELIQTQITQKPVLRAEGECACVAQMARAKKKEWVSMSLTKSEALAGGVHSGNA
jgi:hypothetical protein